MTYVAEDHGKQMRTRDGRSWFVYFFVLSCGCRVEVDVHDIMLMQDTNEFGSACDEMVSAHTCSATAKALTP